MPPEPEFVQALKEYESIFGETPPMFGYPDDILFIALKKAIKTKTPMPGYDEVINDDLGITDEDKDAGKLIRI